MAVHAHRSPPPAAKRTEAARTARPSPPQRAPIQLQEGEPRSEAPPRAALGVLAAAGARLAERRAEGPNRTGLPDRLKAGVEARSGLAMDDVRVHRNSSEPAKLGALAYTQGSDIHLGPDQEEHLPHEAWHVVQQKQGRVKATTQMKGVEINDDAALEAEANRMAIIAEGNKLPTHDRKSTTVNITSRVAQRTVSFMNAPLLPSPQDSLVLQRHIDSPILFFMKENWKGNRKDTAIHLIDSRCYYLLGERHDKTSNWGPNTQFWLKSVPAMCEGVTEIPGDDRVYLQSGGIKELPLEDTDLWVLQACVLLINTLNELMAAPKAEKCNIFQVRKEELSYLPDLFYLHLEYESYCKKLKLMGDVSEKAKAILVFSDRLKKAYVPTLKHLQIRLLKIKKIVCAKNFHPVPWSSELVEHFSFMDDYRGVLPLMVEDLTDLVGIKRQSAEGKLLKTVSAPSEKFHPRTTDVLMDRRDLGMSARIKAVKPPLLVQLGEDHLPGVTSGVGAAVTKPVSRLTSLDAVTLTTK